MKGWGVNTVFTFLARSTLMQSNQSSNLDGIRDLIEHLDMYYDKIMSGELNWTELLESRMTPSATEQLTGRKGDKGIEQ
jgi:hypothetical protein